MTEKKNKKESITKRDIVDAIVEANKITSDNQSKKSSELLKGIITLSFDIMKVLLIILGIIFTISMIMSFNDLNSKYNVWVMISSYSIGGFIIILVFLFARVCFVVSKEIKNERDSNYVIGYFSALVSFVALIIALLSLIKQF